MLFNSHLKIDKTKILITIGSSKTYVANFLITAAGNRESFLDPVFLTIYELGSVQISDTLMSDGYFLIFLTN